MLRSRISLFFLVCKVIFVCSLLAPFVLDYNNSAAQNSSVYSTPYKVLKNTRLNLRLSLLGWIWYHSGGQGKVILRETNPDILENVLALEKQNTVYLYKHILKSKWTNTFRYWFALWQMQITRPYIIACRWNVSSQLLAAMVASTNVLPAQHRGKLPALWNTEEDLGCSIGTAAYADCYGRKIWPQARYVLKRAH